MKKNLLTIGIALLFCFGLLLAGSENDYDSIVPNMMGLGMLLLSGLLFKRYDKLLKDSFLLRDEE